MSINYTTKLVNPYVTAKFHGSFRLWTHNSAGQDKDEEEEKGKVEKKVHKNKEKEEEGNKRNKMKLEEEIRIETYWFSSRSQ